MQEKYRKIIQTHFQELVKKIEANVMMKYLYEKGIISEEDMEAIRSNDTPEKKNEALLLQLERKGPDAFERLFDGLRKNQASLADYLLEEGKSPSRRISKIRNIYMYFYVDYISQVCLLDFTMQLNFLME